MLPQVEIILPCYNPQKDWQKGLTEFYHEASSQYNLSFIVVNDGSVTGDIAQKVMDMQAAGISIRLISYPKNRGKGYALRQGVSASQSPFVLYTDIDFPFTTPSVVKVLSAVTSGKADVVAGYREEGYYSNKMSAFRRGLSRSFRFFIRKGLQMPVTDTQCGLKAFNQTGRNYFLKTSINRYLFDFEFIYLVCKSKGITIATVPAELKNNVVFSKMKFSILFQEMFNLFSVLLKRPS